jgi:hypothetical protein
MLAASLVAARIGAIWDQGGRELRAHETQA